MTGEADLMDHEKVALTQKLYDQRQKQKPKAYV